jgi:hypothetical protein
MRLENEHQVPYGEARQGDWVEADASRGASAHRGMILEVLGSPGHEHFRVRWDEAHESIFYPADGVRVYRGEAETGA